MGFREREVDLEGVGNRGRENENEDAVVRVRVGVNEMLHADSRDETYRHREAENSRERKTERVWEGQNESKVSIEEKAGETLERSWKFSLPRIPFPSTINVTRAGNEKPNRVLFERFLGAVTEKESIREGWKCKRDRIIEVRLHW